MVVTTNINQFDESSKTIDVPDTEKNIDISDDDEDELAEPLFTEEEWRNLLESSTPPSVEIIGGMKTDEPMVSQNDTWKTVLEMALDKGCHVI